MHCEHCGIRVEPDARFCAECGEAVPPPAVVDVIDPAPRTRRRRLAVAAFALWTLGIAAVGAAGGYAVWDRLSPHAAGPVTVRPVGSTLAEATTSATVVMPDVTALDKQSALEALASAGIDPSTVTFGSSPYAAPAGSVVTQSPLGGTASPGAVSLTLATAARVPKVVGSTSDVATATLEALGAVVQARQVYARGVTVGTVVRSQPAVGAALTGPVTLFVSSAPAALFLADLAASRLDCSTGSVTVSGATFEHSVTCSGGGTEPRENTWVLDKRVDGVAFSAGLSSDSSPSGRARITVVADGRTIRTITVGFGGARGFTLPLVGVTQLSFRVLGDEDTTVALGDLRVLGTATGIGALQARSQ